MFFRCGLRAAAQVLAIVLSVSPVLGEAEARKTLRSVVLVAEGRTATHDSTGVHELFRWSFAQRFEKLTGQQVEVVLQLPGREPKAVPQSARIAYELGFRAFAQEPTQLTFLTGYGTFKFIELEVGPIEFRLDPADAEMLVTNDCTPAPSRACQKAAIEAAKVAVAEKLGAILVDALHRMKLLEARSE